MVEPCVTVIAGVSGVPLVVGTAEAVAEQATPPEEKLTQLPAGTADTQT
jgi:hypothetical protein